MFVGLSGSPGELRSGVAQLETSVVRRVRRGPSVPFDGPRCRMRGCAERCADARNGGRYVRIWVLDKSPETTPLKSNEKVNYFCEKGANQGGEWIRECITLSHLIVTLTSLIVTLKPGDQKVTGRVLGLFPVLHSSSIPSLPTRPLTHSWVVCP